MSAQEEGDGQTISLPRTLEVATRQSPTLRTATIDVDVAEASVQEATGIEDWVLTANGVYSLSRAEAVSGNVIGTNENDSASFDTSISKLLSTGGTLNVSASARRQRAVFAFMDMESLQYNTDFDVSLTQPLLSGRGSTVTRAQQRQAEIRRDVAALTRQSSMRNLVRDIVIAYWEVAFAHRSLEIRRGALDLARERERLTKRRVALGNAAPTELTAVEQIIATRQEEILSAEVTVTQRSLELRRLAGLEIDPENIDVATTDIATARPVPLDRSEVLERTLDTSPELQILAARGEGATLDVKVTDNGLLPVLDLTVNGGPVGVGETFSDSFSTLTGAEGYQLGARLTFRQRLGNNQAEGAHDRARQAQRQLKVDLQDLKAQLAVEVVRAVNQARSAEQRMKLSELAISLSKKNIEAEQRRFELGRSTNFDVLQRQDELEQSQLRYARAAVDYLVARAQIDALTGDILASYGIKDEAPVRPAP